jgi:hypothetical protein
MELILTMEGIHVKNKEQSLKDFVSLLKTAVNSLIEKPLLEELRFSGYDNDDRFKLNLGVPLLLESIEASYLKTIVFSDNEANTIGGNRLLIGLTKKWFDITLKLTHDKINEFGNELLDMFKGVVFDLYRDLKSEFLLRDCHVGIYDLNIPELKPPRDHEFFGLNTPLEFIDEEFYLTNPHRDHALARKLLDLKGVPTLKTTEKFGLHCLQWSNTLEEQRLIENVLTRKKVMAQALELEVDDRYNLQGDEWYEPPGLGEHDVLTFYSAMYGIGIKAVVLDENQELEEEIKEMLTTWVRNGKLEDGTELRSLNLILPNRDSAVGFREKATQMGIKKVLHIDDDRVIWDPFPEGTWVDFPMK